jgi:O-antigen ligase
LTLATLAAAAAFALSAKVQSPSALITVGGIALVLAVLAMLLSPRIEVSLVVLMLYLGLADGYVKLGTDAPYATLVRDALLYAVAIGALLRLAIQRRAMPLPPLTGWVLAFVVVVLMQIANPSGQGVGHSVAAARQHLEFVPLFFIGAYVLRDSSCLRAFAWLLLGIAAINGIVNLVQLNLSPEQMASWGPGYRRFVFGAPDLAARVFTDQSGVEHPRPFGLGSDLGFGGFVAMLAFPAALALTMTEARRRARATAALLLLPTVVGILASQTRTVVVGSLLALLAFAVLTGVARRAVSGVVPLLVGGVVTVVAFVALASGGGSPAFDRYSPLASRQILDYSVNYRGPTFAAVPTYIKSFPLGAGLGTIGPASKLTPADERKTLNGENEFTFLVVELGVPGLVLLALFHLRLLVLVLARIARVPSSQDRLLLAGLAAPLFALLAIWSAASTTATTPAAPYFWLCAGMLGTWLYSHTRNRNA